MKTIWKYIIPTEDEFSLDLPKEAICLCFDTQSGIPTLWVMVDPEAKKEKRHFRFAGTGHPLNTDKWQHTYIDTAKFAGDQLIFHLFELTDPQIIQ